jgi:hypothetical protein
VDAACCHLEKSRCWASEFSRALTGALEKVAQSLTMGLAALSEIAHRVCARSDSTADQNCFYIPFATCWKNPME